MRKIGSDCEDNNVRTVHRAQRFGGGKKQMNVH